ncbi:hypothetical protein IWW38_003144 [Coemansia aciculifera]|uniref:Uncharacterized protein n=1 Tax=Coemansia aciculifera TaxID=417176 RepID=A0ACC1M3A0_9FUNG|nr:hypothetical protein IWW38_003144 [Coemansia aciculifera]
MSKAIVSRHSLPALSCTRHFPSRRGLATGVIYIDSKPSQATRQTLYDQVQKHSNGSHVYDVWISAPTTRRNLVFHRAAIRITTEPVPTTVEAISLLPDPTNAEIEAIRAASLEIVKGLKAEAGVNALPILKDPGFFQTTARRALGHGPQTRLFDKFTTSKPRFTRGMLDGYREGFLEARKIRDANDIVEQSKRSDDALGFLADYFEHKYHHKL